MKKIVLVIATCMLILSSYCQNISRLPAGNTLKKTNHTAQDVNGGTNTNPPPNTSIPANATGGSQADFLVRSTTEGQVAYRKGNTGLAIQYIICSSGLFPINYGTPGVAGPFTAEIRALLIYNDQNIPAGWYPCDGRLLPFAPNQSLFALIGFTYGGSNQTGFALPDLRGATLVGIGNGWAFGEKSN